MSEPKLATRGWSWPDGARLALSIVVNVEEGSELSLLHGDRGPEPVDELGVVVKKPIRMHGNESNYRYGIVEGAPRIRELLDRHQIRATWTAASLALERAPDLARAIAARGDETCCHGFRWIHQFGMDEERERDFIRRGWQSIERTTGTRPVGWLSRYLHTDATRRLLIEEGYRYHMDDYSADAPFWESVEMHDGTRRPIVIVPYALDSNDMKFWLAPALTPEAWFAYARDTFDQLYEEGAIRPRMMSLGTHLRIIGRPGRIGALRRFLEHVRAKSDVWIATRSEIAAHFATQVEAPL